MAQERVSGPMDLRWRSWRGALTRTFGAFWSDKLTDWAAALTYYSVLSLFPALLLLTALLGLLGRATTDSMIATVRQVGPGNETAFVVGALENLRNTQSLSGPLALVGLVTAVWTASAYIGAFIRAANSLYEIDEGRSIWKTLPLRFGLTLTMLAVAAACAVGVVVTGTVARKVGQWLGVGSAGIRVWDVLKWPVLALLVSLAFALLYWAAPNVRQPGFRWLTPGSVLAVLIWIAASAGFAFYVANFGSFNRVYGSLAAAVIFLMWLWITNLAVLIGADIDAELARGRGMEQGRHPDQTPFLPPRDEPETQHTQ
ncbi:YihY/virulence factor BrkB family protein [Nocardia terpenica]|uniref:YihY/virulence factor BrkB family protein n=1 Tax=Nocardia terpenica TaxID=455432 RepID=UPI001895D488|nr:YihY/virulence factor BrkB family protein [Nocardia terpenica]MBF6065270.1 YihY/virulence factor BrkB family protein [Nocardia terpenica]MBF6107997.1 YihY/virulence factor BrkB family protein [Nocardia terpenica]MBF6115472.1 YihY/virulence factor BrkB family protein [Nocardia terpenica]MBF6121909.1 YihY/virulence factor BrkB family protein [Nocardia terpenica]MBF6155547.1 YihY/virulence factor BrkB family protein [Nocardia terpenica]